MTKSIRLRLLAALLGGALSAAAADPPAIFAGTVFRDAGFALRGAEIVVKPAGSAAKKGERRAVSDARGEFLVRLADAPGRYTVVVRAAGMKPSEQEMTLAAGERLDRNFLLEAASGSAK